MALTQYRKKRSFNKTPEPTGGKASGNQLRFVIQKHDATRLHYDFRLEMEGVLKSWAVPKGPSLNPEDKRLAMMVEDHPYDYRSFEGIIPKGNYGAGTVIVWDEGTYEPLEPIADKKDQEKSLLKQLKSGSLKVVLHGTKLKGEFALVKLKNSEDNAWLLIKHRDKYAKETDVTKKDKSVVSGKTIARMEKSPDNVWGKQDPKRAAKKTAVKKTATAKRSTAAKKSPAKKKAREKTPTGKKAPFPKIIQPMLATLVSEAYDQAGWTYEIKWDGYRAVAYMNKGKVNILSRNNKPFNEKFYPIYNTLQEWTINAVVDGEIAVLNDQGISHFGSLQNWRSEADGILIYYLFDILWLEGQNLMGLPLTERRKILADNMPAFDNIRMSESFETTATDFLEAAARMGMEGIIAKKADSEYRPGERTRDWLKIKAQKRHEVVIGGYTQNEGSGKSFSSLLVGLYDNNKLEYIGKIGTGFTNALQKEIMAKMNKLAIKKCPFTEEPDVNKPSRFRPNPPKASVTWVKPQLVCEVSYVEITEDGVMRHPSFEGLRIDKKAKDVVKEVPVEAKEMIKGPKKTNNYTKPAKASGRNTLLNPKDETQVREINGHELKFSNLGKIYWPKEKYTKRDMLNYYYQVAPYILPYLKDRPQSLNRYPNGINGKSFYQKDVTGKAPGWIKMEPYHTSDGEDKNFMVPEDDASLLYMANLGAIEMNPWNSTIHKPDHPDWCLIDLDPTEKNSFEQVIQTAQVTKQVLDELGVPGYPKTSGSTGIHIYIPLGAKYTYDECQLFGKLIATEVHHRLPDFTSITRLTKNRKGKLYVDYLQNRPKATLAAPYSLRPKPGATVSMPLYWEEVKKGLQMKDFTIANAIGRIKKEGDIFKPVIGKGIDMIKALKKLQ